ncbi:MAG TPA: hypothetical protein DEB33_00920 [Gemmatimonadetes bacterium]|nr:hypothetical protein [Gemmatimonadota bacterium]
MLRGLPRAGQRYKLVRIGDLHEQRAETMTRTIRPHVLNLSLTGFVALWSASVLTAQEPVEWGEDFVFHTFSIAGVDPVTGESGVAVTTRNACVGNGVPWVRVGIGAVATQASTRTAYGKELLDMLEEGVSPQEALDLATASDEGRENRQIGVVSIDGRAAQFTGSGPGAWAGHRSGQNYAAQGNVLVGPEVVNAVAETFESSEGSERHLADRLVEALEAGQAVGGDRRDGRLQSASVVVVDPRQGMARREDGQTVHINVCQHLTPVAEVRRIYDTVSGTLGFRELSIPTGNDVWQVKLLMNALGYFRPDDKGIDRSAQGMIYDGEIARAVDVFRNDQGLSNPSSGGTPSGFVDAELAALMWKLVEETGRAHDVRKTIRDATRIRR